MKVIHTMSMRETMEYEIRAMGIFGTLLYAVFGKVITSMWERKYKRYLRDIISDANSIPPNKVTELQVAELLLESAAKHEKALERWLKK